MLAAAVLATGCKKSDGPLPVGDAVAPEGAMLFNVRIDGIGTKSHFADDASTVSGETASLVWDADDDISVTAVKVPDSWSGDIMEVDLSVAKSCRAVIIPSSISGGSATFTAVDAADDWWKADGDTDEDSQYIFMATYPANGNVIPLEVLMNVSFEEEGEVYSFTDYTQFLTVPVEQDGKSFNRYQSLMDVKLDDPFTYAELSEKSRTITFDAFQPSTGLLHFRLVSFDENVNYTNIDHINISARLYSKGTFSVGSYQDPGTGETVEYRKDYYYLNEEYKDVYGFAGTGYIPYFCQAFHDDTYGVIMMDMNRLDWGVEFNSKLSSSKLITIKPPVSEQPITIPYALSEAKEFYVVIAALPTWFIGDDECGAIVFEAFDASGKLVAVSEKLMPEEGFLPGVRYNFNLAMGKPLDIDGIDAGGYDGIVELTQ